MRKFSSYSLHLIRPSTYYVNSFLSLDHWLLLTGEKIKQSSLGDWPRTHAVLLRPCAEWIRPKSIRVDVELTGQLTALECRHSQSQLAKLQTHLTSVQTCSGRTVFWISGSVRYGIHIYPARFEDQDLYRVTEQCGSASQNGRALNS